MMLSGQTRKLEEKNEVNNITFVMDDTWRGGLLVARFAQVLMVSLLILLTRQECR